MYVGGSPYLLPSSVNAHGGENDIRARADALSYNTLFVVLYILVSISSSASDEIRVLSGSRVRGRVLPFRSGMRNWNGPVL